MSKAYIRSDTRTGLLAAVAEQIFREYYATLEEATAALTPRREWAREKFLDKARSVFDSCVNRKMVLGQLATHSRCEAFGAIRTIADDPAAHFQTPRYARRTATHAGRLFRWSRGPFSARFSAAAPSGLHRSLGAGCRCFGEWLQRAFRVCSSGKGDRSL